MADLDFQEQLPPAKFVFDDPDRRGAAIDSMVSGGCIISGSRVTRSLLFSNVRVSDYSSIEQSVVLPRVRVGERCVIKRAIIDEGALVPDGMQIGVDPAAAERFYVTEAAWCFVTAAMLRSRLSQPAPVLHVIHSRGQEKSLICCARRVALLARWCPARRSGEARGAAEPGRDPDHVGRHVRAAVHGAREGG
jgi:hypothetical protein